MSIKAAMDLTIWAHDGQHRKDGVTPYVVHCFDVVSRLRQWGINPYDHSDIYEAAFLHDSLEDGPPNTLVFMESEKFSKNTSIFVKELTRNTLVSKEEYLKYFEHCRVESLVIKIADRICNINDFVLAGDNYAYKYAKYGKILIKIADEKRATICARIPSLKYDKMISDFYQILSVASAL